MTQRRLFLTIVATGLAATTGAFAQPYGPPGGPPPHRPIPPPREELAPELRRSRQWEPGHWHWNGRDYVWIRGRDIARRERDRHYVQGEWARRGGGWVWIGGHWE